MKKFNINEYTGEIKKASEIYPGCVVGMSDVNPVTVKSYDTKEEALEALEALDTEINEYPGYFLITEYAVEEVECDDDGDNEEFIDTWEYSKLNISVVDWENDVLIGEFDNYEDASKAEDEFIERVESDGETIADTRILFRKF